MDKNNHSIKNFLDKVMGVATLYFVVQLIEEIIGLVRKIK